MHAKHAVLFRYTGCFYPLSNNNEVGVWTLQKSFDPMIVLQTVLQLVWCVLRTDVKFIASYFFVMRFHTLVEEEVRRGSTTRKYDLGENINWLKQQFFINIGKFSSSEKLFWIWLGPIFHFHQTRIHLPNCDNMYTYKIKFWRDYTIGWRRQFSYTW